LSIGDNGNGISPKHKHTTTAKAVHIAIILKKRKQQLRKREFRRKWQTETDRVNRLVLGNNKHDETDILSRVVQLENELGHEPSLLDILCRFNRAEIQPIWDSLVWLYSDLGRKEEYVRKNPPSTHRPGANRTLMEARVR
jgi:hypothetical protein